MAFELDDLEPRYEAYWVSFKLSKSRMKVKVIG